MACGKAGKAGKYRKMAVKGGLAVGGYRIFMALNLPGVMQALS
ncbi:MAG: hypothetical protein VCA55_08305 [Verrucomicrobiales bacterium]|jgi:hypothetical protein